MTHQQTVNTMPTPQRKPRSKSKARLKAIALAQPPGEAPLHFAPRAIEHAPRRIPMSRGEKAAIALLLLVLLAALAFCIAAIEGHAQIRGL